MPDTIGRISVPVLIDSGLTFPFTSDFGHGFSQERPVVAHQFGELDAKAEQRFAVGIGPRKFAFRWRELPLRGARSRRRPGFLRLLLRFCQRLPGAWRS